MKANELRIGNLIYDPLGQVMAVTHVTLSLLSIATTTQQQFNYIPLTEEWLLKFGWKKHTETDENIGQYHWFSFGTYETRNIGTGIVGIYDVHNEADIANVKYVHQLQNLYFALTGEELTLSEGIDIGQVIADTVNDKKD